MTSTKQDVDAMFAYRLQGGFLELYDRSPLLREEPQWQRPLVTVPIIEHNPHSHTRHVDLRETLDRAVDKAYEHSTQKGNLRVSAVDIKTGNSMVFDWYRKTERTTTS
jgi:predicted acylesterase/phospholipase RssA